MREGWEYKKLGDVSFYPNNRISLSELTPDEYVGVECLVKDKGGVSFSDELPNADAAIEFVKNDILIGNIRPYLKKIWLSDKRGGASGDVVNIRVAEEYKEYLFASYLYKVLSTDAFFEYDNSNTHGAKMPRGNRKAIAEYRIPVPPKSTQLAIVAELDQINELIRLKKEQLKEYDNLAQSIFYEMFGDPVENEKGWEVKKLGELVELKNGLNFTPTEDGYKIRIIGVADFKDNSVITGIDTIGFKNIKEDVSQDYYLKDGDILIVRSNGSKELVGRNLIVYTNGEMITYSGFCIRCRIKDLSIVSSVYLNAFLSKREIRMLLRQEGRGANISNINQKILNSQRIPLPPLPLQQEFSSRIEQIEQLKAEVQKTITDLETLLASRMQYWFE